MYMVFGRVKPALAAVASDGTSACSCRSDRRIVGTPFGRAADEKGRRDRPFRVAPLLISTGHRLVGAPEHGLNLPRVEANVTGPLAETVRETVAR